MAARRNRFRPAWKGQLPSLGYQVLDWQAAHLEVPDGPMIGQPWVPTDRQARFTIRFYALDPVTGRRLYRRAGKKGSKGTGKSPDAAAWSLAEALGPVRFDGWDADGQPVGVPWPSPLVQVAACSEDQTDNTYSAVYAMAASDALNDAYPIDLGRTRIYVPDAAGGMTGEVSPVTSSTGTREGQRVTAAVLDETHLWVPSTGGPGLARVLRRNVAKMGGTTLETTNAYVPGIGSVAEASEKAWRARTDGLLWESFAVDDLKHLIVDGEAVPDLLDKSAVMEALAWCYQDCPWVDLERLYAEMLDPEIGEDDARRFYLNQVVAAQAQAFDAKKWDRDDLATEGLPKPGTAVALGFDGSESQDSTALIGCEWDTGRVFVVQVWERDENNPAWRVDETAVDAAFTDAMGTWTVGRVLCDPRGWRPWIKEWAGRWGDKVVLEFPTNSWRRMAPAVDGFASSLNGEQGIPHDGSDVLRSHLAHCRKQLVNPNRPEAGWVVVKDGPNSKRKIDAAVAAILARHARALLIGEGWTPPTLATADFFTI